MLLLGENIRSYHMFKNTKESVLIRIYSTEISSYLRLLLETSL